VHIENDMVQEKIAFLEKLVFDLITGPLAFLWAEKFG